MRGQLRAASLVRAFDAWDQVELRDLTAGRRSRPPRDVPADDRDRALARFDLSANNEGGLQLVTSTGMILTGYAVFKRLVRGMRLLWPLAWVTWIPGVAHVAQGWFPGTPPQTGAFHREKVAV
jgi:hypothetical protein